ncbi:epimerase [Putridiphycobacter roseus]|uniref:Epimerase n=1 Tax=Putridiphycobacter roseus TaxID=2219161 RepID=A0A2W1N0J9_9FLAO|nr:NAD-dependent epimerase/dehydratase family protein [Putridiphycobacter roseus]PZE17264.1 epimerase [Putridiphycobacter roseus]
MRKILITGGAGNVGSALAAKLIEDQNNKVTVVDDLSTGSLSKLDLTQSNLKFIKADVNKKTELSEIMLANRFDYVFHYAALVGVQRTQENPVKVLEDIQGIKNILNISKNIGVKRFFFSSSSEVYGEPVSIPQNESTTPLNSKLPYAVVKNVGESFCRSYQQEYGLDYTIFRFFNTYGPHQTTDFVMAKFISQALKNEPITVFGDGKQTRTFCYVEDNIDMCIKALNENKIVNDVVNVGGDKIITIIDLAKTIIKITKSKSEIIHLPPLPSGDMKRRQPDNRKMLNLLNRDLISIEEGIQKLLDSEAFRKEIGV